MIPKLTDDAVSHLPLGAGRAELLEEIMTTVAPDRTTEPTPDQRSSGRRWLVPLAAAAVVAGIAGSSLWWEQVGEDPGPRGSAPVAGLPSGASASPASPTPSEAPSVTSGHRAVLDAEGWQVRATESSDDGYGEVDYTSGRTSLQITWYPAKSYASYVEDREHIVDPPAPGRPVEVLGKPGQLWAYSAQDHTVIREVQDGHWMEFRGSGINETGYLALLAQLRLVDLQGFEQALPDRFVTDTERADAVAALLQGIEAASGAGYPDGQPGAPKSEQQDPYQLGAAVAGSYACAWLDELAAATAAGAAARADEAARVLGTARDWPVLDQMNPDGDYPEVLWGYADEAASGQLPSGYAGGLGCR